MRGQIGDYESAGTEVSEEIPMLAIEEIKDIVGEIAEEFDEAVACGDTERAAELAREQSVATDIWLANTEHAARQPAPVRLKDGGPAAGPESREPPRSSSPLRTSRALLALVSQP
jgi:hypothetical protein